MIKDLDEKNEKLQDKIKEQIDNMNLMNENYQNKLMESDGQVK